MTSLINLKTKRTRKRKKKKNAMKWNKAVFLYIFLFNEMSLTVVQSLHSSRNFKLKPVKINHRDAISCASNEKRTATRRRRVGHGTTVGYGVCLENLRQLRAIGFIYKHTSTYRCTRRNGHRLQLTSSWRSRTLKTLSSGLTFIRRVRSVCVRNRDGNKWLQTGV